jgi:membrane protein
MKPTIELLKSTYAEWSEDKASRLAAALAYYTILSLSPFLIVVLAITALAFGKEAAQGELINELQNIVGPQGAQAIQTVIANASKPQSGILATILGMATLLFGASGVFGELKDGLNTIWDVEAKTGRGVIGFIQDRFVSLAMVMGVGFLLLVSLMMSAALAGVGKYVGGLLPLPTMVLEIINFIISFAVITILFALIFKVLPDVIISWRDVWIGAAITSFLFTIGKFLLGLYLGRSGIATVYGAAGSLVLILAWVYYSAQILFFGAEFTQVYANQYGSHIKPDKDAIPLTDAARAQQGISESQTDITKAKLKKD